MAKIALTLLVLGLTFEHAGATDSQILFPGCRYQGVISGVSHYYCGPGPLPALPNVVMPWQIVRIPRLVERSQQSASLIGKVHYQHIAHALARQHGVDARLVESVITIESQWNPWAVSEKGARGLMQLMPKTAETLGVRNTFDPHDNIDGGVRHLKGLLEEFRWNRRLALAAYNAGSEAVAIHRGIPPFPETRQYVEKILAEYRRGS